MTYFDIINQAIELCVTVDSQTGLAYLEPPYRMLLRDAGLIHEDIISTEELCELLKLEVEKINAKANHTHAVASWIFDIINGTIDPAMTQEENEMMKNFLEYMRLNQEHKVKDEEPVDEEQAQKNDVTPIETDLSSNDEE